MVFSQPLRIKLSNIVKQLTISLLRVLLSEAEALFNTYEAMSLSLPGCPMPILILLKDHKCQI